MMTKEEIYESIYYEGQEARENNVPIWCTTYERKLKQLWKKGWEDRDKKIKGEK